MMVVMLVFILLIIIVVMVVMFVFILIIIVVMMVMMFMLILIVIIVMMVVMFMLILIVIVVMMVVMLMLIFIMIMMMLMFVFFFLFFVLIRSEIFRESVTGSCHCFEDRFACQIIPRCGNDACFRIQFMDDINSCLQLLIGYHLCPGEDHTCCCSDLIIEELFEVPVIDLASCSIHNSYITVELNAFDRTDRFQNIGKLADTGRLNNDPVRMIVFKNLLQSSLEITFQCAADASAVDLRDLDSGILQESAVNTDLSEFILNKYDLLTREYFFQQFCYQCSFSGSEKTGYNINFCHNSVFSFAQSLYTSCQISILICPCKRKEQMRDLFLSLRLNDPAEQHAVFAVKIHIFMIMPEIPVPEYRLFPDFLEVSVELVSFGNRYDRSQNAHRSTMADNIINVPVMCFQIPEAFFRFCFGRHFLRPPADMYFAHPSVHGCSAAECEPCFPVDLIYLSAHQMQQVAADAVYLSAMPHFHRKCIDQIKVFMISVDPENCQRKGGEPVQQSGVMFVACPYASEISGYEQIVISCLSFIIEILRKYFRNILRPVYVTCQIDHDRLLS